MDAFALLKNDHKRVAALFDEIEPTTERAVKTREEAFGKLKEELDVHAHIEEEILYPALKKRKFRLHHISPRVEGLFPTARSAFSKTPGLLPGRTGFPIYRGFIARLATVATKSLGETGFATCT